MYVFIAIESKNYLNLNYKVHELFDRKYGEYTFELIVF